MTQVMNAPKDSFASYILPYRDRRLTIFMPFVHPARTKGMAEAFRDRGHRLMLSDSSSNAKIRDDHPLPPAVATEMFGPNASSYVENQIYDDPPDVIIVGSVPNEEDCLRLAAQLNQKKPVALLAMSGNAQSMFDFSKYDGLICCDLLTRTLARCNNVPAIRYVEATWMSDYPARVMPREPRFYLRSFINNLARRWPLSTSFHAECARLIADAYGGEVVAENLENLPIEEVRRLMVCTPMLLHIKDEEGFGWSILEALFTGRPIIYQEGLSKNMAFLDWIETGVSGFPIRQPSDILPIVDRFRNDLDALDVIHRRTAAIVRELYDGPERAEDMVQFVCDLHRIARARWIPNRSDVPTRSPASYEGNLDPAHLQDYVNVWNESTTGSDPRR